MQFFKNNTTRALILILSALVVCTLAITYFVYKNIDESVDPRIVKARLLYEKYNGYAQNNEFDSVFALMDSIELIYSSIDHYKNSYEIGVLYNNRAASYLTMALFADTNQIDRSGRDSIISLAETAANRSIGIYEQWLTIYQQKKRPEIQELVLQNFFTGLEMYNKSRKRKFLKQRVKEIEEALVETQRRVSVSYTNLGIIHRSRLQYESAAICYKKAVELWDENLTAENNLNILLGKPLRKRNIIQKLFPPNHNKN
jgi:tetratricopeptide (TPR) repeat protein